MVDTSPSVLAGMISFTPKIGSGSGTILMNINTAALSSYVGSVAQQYYKAPSEPSYQYNGSAVTVLNSPSNGLTAMVGGHQIVADPSQTALYANLLHTFTSLSPGRTIRAPVLPVKPPLDLTNPASLGVTTLLGEGQSSFAGSPTVRVDDIESIAKTLNGVLIKPGEQISFNYYAGSGWPARVYGDAGQQTSGGFAPGTGGAMQQVATTFFRAGYEAGLPVLERHAHQYRLPWYEPPAGEDAIVSLNGKDLRFNNTTGGYLLVQTRVEPVQQSLYIYFYGIKTGWSVNVSTPVLLREYKHGAPVIQPDSSQPSGTRTEIQYPRKGADFNVTRTVTIPGPKGTHSVQKDTLFTHYDPAPAVFLVGTAGNKLHPGPTPTPTPNPTPTPTSTQPPHRLLRQQPRRRSLQPRVGQLREIDAGRQPQESRSLALAFLYSSSSRAPECCNAAKRSS